VLTSLAMIALQAPAPPIRILKEPENPITMYDLFSNSALVPKVVVVVLLALAVAAVAVCTIKVLSGPRLSGGSTFLSSLRLGAPLLGLLGGVWGFMNTFLGIANFGPISNIAVVAPGVAESIFIIFVGLLVGVVAVICHWAVEAKIDRTVLKG
jgi:hypothetical protein